MGDLGTREAMTRTVRFGDLDWLIIDETDDGEASLLLCEKETHVPWVPDDLLGGVLMGTQTVTWETSAARGLLNGEFLDAHLSAGERSRVVPVELDNRGNPFGDASDDGVTVDRVFMLSLEEAVRYLSPDAEAEEVAILSSGVLTTRTPLDAACPVRFVLEGGWLDGVGDYESDEVQGRLDAIRAEFPGIDGLLEHTMEAWEGYDTDTVNARPAMWVRAEG